MAVEYKDYYKLLEVSRDASQDDISRAFKKLARKYHPDLNPGDPHAEAKFKEINEAYEVLKDPEKRKLYDSLGPHWKDGQNFQPPPGFENIRFHTSGSGFGSSRFSDFFEMFFGSPGFDVGAGTFSFHGGSGGFSGRHMRGQDTEMNLVLSLEEAYRGGPKTISLTERLLGPDGRPHMHTRTLNVQIPAGVKDGAKIRLVGQGEPGLGGPAGDLYLRVEIAPHPLFKVAGNDVVYDLRLAPWEAVLGTTVRVPTLGGEVELKIPPGVSSGQKIRIPGRGLGSSGQRGDQLVRMVIRSPKNLTDQERRLWQELARISSFAART
jgi:curved DNA-binding protein